MWSRLRSAMVKFNLDPVRIENKVGVGTPDVNYKEGWIELKHLDNWPPRAKVVRLTHPPTKEQKVWLYRRWSSGGNAWLVLRIDQDWFAFAGRDVRLIWLKGRAPTRAILFEYAKLHTNDPDEVAQFLKRGRS